jgi:hypothetical protein
VRNALVAFVTGAAALVGCAAQVKSPAAASAPIVPPGCIRAEASSHTGGAQEMTFDADGNLTRIVELDNGGKDVARTTLEWSTTSITVSRTGAFQNIQRGVLGEHGELVDWKTDSEHVTLRWDGTFAPVTASARERFAFETYYHVIGDQPLLPLDTASRGVWPRMRAFVYTGTVVLHRDGTLDTEDARATYDHGHQIERSIPGGRGRPRVDTKTTWRGDAPVEQTSSDGTKRTFSSQRGHLTGMTGGPDVAFTYDDAFNLTHVRTNHGTGSVVDVDVSRCADR